MIISDTFEEQPDDGHKDIVDVIPSWPKKYYVDGENVEIAANVVFDLDADGKRLRMVKLTEYAGEKVKTLWRTPEELRDAWVDVDRRCEIISELAKRGIEFQALADAAKLPDATRSTCCAISPSSRRADPERPGGEAEDDPQPSLEVRQRAGKY